MARGWLGKGDPHRGLAVVQTRLQKDPMHPGLQTLQVTLQCHLTQFTAVSPDADHGSVT